MARNMLARFSLYGFLKNQKYYEPFLILAFRDKGLSFFVIGLLVGFRQVWVNVLEIPSGYLADTFGRRRSMILSFVAYILSFVIFAVSQPLWTLFVGMLFFAIGEAFRTGTHKAMIFDWLTSEGRSGERTRVYGYTRSWSQIGSAVSVVLAAIAVLVTENYVSIFWLSTIPYLIAIVNFLGYPSYLDSPGGPAHPDTEGKTTLSSLSRGFVEILMGSWKNRPLRRLFFESAVHRGSASLTKDYIQPLLRQAAIALPIFTVLNGERRAALLVGIVYAVLYLVSSFASRRAHRFADRLGGNQNSSRKLWLINTLLFSAACAGILAKWDILAALLFAAIIIMQNVWRPIMMSRIDDVSEGQSGATILSIDSQAGSLYLLIFAPVLGAAADVFGLWPIALFGGISAGLFWIISRRDSVGPS